MQTPPPKKKKKKKNAAAHNSLTTSTSANRSVAGRLPTVQTTGDEHDSLHLPSQSQVVASREIRPTSDFDGFPKNEFHRPQNPKAGPSPRPQPQAPAPGPITSPRPEAQGLLQRVGSRCHHVVWHLKATLPSESTDFTWEPYCGNCGETFLGFFRWCRISSIHRMASHPTPFLVGTLYMGICIQVGQLASAGPRQARLCAPRPWKKKHNGRRLGMFVLLFPLRRSIQPPIGNCIGVSFVR